MIPQVKELPELESIELLKRSLQDMLLRQIDTAKAAGEMDEFTHQSIVNRFCEEKTRSGVLDYYAKIFSEIEEYHYHHLLHRLIKGAEFIESITTTDPRYVKAMQKYDAISVKVESYKAASGIISQMS